MEAISLQWPPAKAPGLAMNRKLKPSLIVWILIAGDNDYPGTLRCEPLSCDPPDPRCGSSNDNDFPNHRYPLATNWSPSPYSLSGHGHH
jgi:hypothetical protein